MKRAVVVVLVERQGPIHQGPGRREIGHEPRLVEAERDSQSPRAAEIVQRFYVILAERRYRILWVKLQPLGDSGMVDLHAAETVVSGPYVHFERSRVELRRNLVVIPLSQIGVRLEERVGVQRKTGASKEQCVLPLW